MTLFNRKKTEQELKNMKIVFNNGHVQPIAQEVADIIKNKVVEGCNQFQAFYDEDLKTTLIVNLSEVTCVCPIK